MREKKRKTGRNGEKTNGEDKEYEEKTRMLIGLKLNPTDLSRSDSFFLRSSIRFFFSFLF